MFSKLLRRLQIWKAIKKEKTQKEITVEAG